MFYDFFSLFYPRICAACLGNLSAQEQCLCVSCQYSLPKTETYNNRDNVISKLFWGRADIEIATSYYFFYTGSKIQQLVHRLKYKGQKQVGVYIGEQFGKELKQSALYNSIDVIMPVPLHSKKLKIRGYNQSEYFGSGLGKSMNIKMDTSSLVRIQQSATQTKKTRYERWENVEGVFSINKRDALINKHILLVDDVITTGATIGACANTLLQVKGVKVSVASIAFAEQV